MKRLIFGTFFAVILLFATATVIGIELTVNIAKADGPVPVANAAPISSGTVKEKVARLVPQPVAPPEDVTSGLKVVRLVVPTVGIMDIEPYFLVSSEDDPATRNEKGCWEDEFPNETSLWSHGKNTVLWCHRGAQVSNGIIDFANLKIGDPIWVWAEDTNGGFYALEFRVRWLGQLSRDLQADFMEPTDSWVVTLITCAIEPGLPANPLERIFVRATIDEETNFGVWHYVSRGETVSSIARTYDTTTKVLAEANGLRNPNKISAGQYLFIPLAPGKIGMTFADLP